MAKGPLTPLKIGIVGAGFSGTTLALNLYRLTKRPLEIFLFEKRKKFGLGEAYSTPYPFHLLNIRAHDMSAFEDQPDHFVNWLSKNKETNICLDHQLPMSEQFVPRMIYGKYLQELLENTGSDPDRKIKFIQTQAEVTDVIPEKSHSRLFLSDQQEVMVNKVVLALGTASTGFPFPVSTDINCIQHSWDYTAPSDIEKQDSVFIIGTGLSMIDVVLTLYHQGHQGKIYALSRHGLLPLPHALERVPVIDMKDELQERLLGLTKQIRKKSKSSMNMGGDWRSIINSMRMHIPLLWAKASLFEKKQFVRHLLSYWNIHRHRVTANIADLLNQLSASQQLTIFAGKVLEVTQGKASIQLRGSKERRDLPVNWLINCMGPSFTHSSQTLIQSLLARELISLDPLKLGFEMIEPGVLKDKSGKISSLFYSLGPPAKSIYWESNAVPEIRKQSLRLAKFLLNIQDK